MKRIKILILSFLIISITHSQNLLPNPSFEDQNICDEHTAKCSPAAWFFSRQVTAQGFYTIKVPGIVGNNYLGLIAAQPNSEKRSYWETRLLCGIEKGKKYIIRLQVAADQVGPNLNHIGIYFTNNFIFSWTDTLMQPDNYISLHDAKVKKLKNQWFLIEKEFEATENSSHFIIGNFSQTSNTEILLKLGVKTSYNILIDDLSLTPLKPIPCGEAEAIEKSLYTITKRHLESYAPKAPVVAPPPVVVSPPTEAVTIDTLIIPNVLFDLNSFTLKNDAALDTYQPYFSDPSITKIRVVGFTDAAGSVAYNLKLSSRRAQEVARVLRDRYHVPFALIETEGKGISKDYEEREKNRRVEVYVYH